MHGHTNVKHVQSFLPTNALFIKTSNVLCGAAAQHPVHTAHIATAQQQF
jgi:hypothetical protein